MLNQRNKGTKKESGSMGTTPVRIFKMLLLIAVIVGLGVIFLLMVLPRNRGASPPIKSFTSPTKVDEKPKGDTAKIDPKIEENYTGPEIDEGLTEADKEGSETVVIDEDEVNEEKILDYTGVYVGTGETESANSTTVWELSMELSGDHYLYVEGRINYIEDVLKGTGKELSFVILENSIEMKLSANDKDDVVITSSFDGKKANIFSVNDRRQFFLYVIPSKVNIDTNLLFNKSLIANENTPLIDMSGFIKENGAVVGMFRNPFGDVVEYELGRVNF